MDTIDLAIIGLSQEELQNKLIQSLCDRVLTCITFDEDGDVYSSGSPLSARLRKEIQVRIDDAIRIVADKHVTPQLVDKIESITMQKTNEWGEKKGGPVSFIEYLTDRTEKFMVEPVDTNGRSQEECRRSGNSFYGKGTTRVAQAIDKHLEYSIKTAMEKALADAQSTITVSLTEACKLALADVQSKLKVQVTNK